MHRLQVLSSRPAATEDDRQRAAAAAAAATRRAHASNPAKTQQMTAEAFRAQFASKTEQ
ncbi:MAG: hypothetical protein LH624_08430 [Cryobacterium sp.]|uniref:hypothetical protein n=1 Tax=Cryobacterium sp. MP_3.1 TaxID=3071711 RepID=UPI00229E4D5E|nr:hypothetical protein [Cryobacterium sp.]